jgi:hypothetical protein
MPYGGKPIDALTYHYDNLRTGWNPSETDLTPASVASKNFGLLKTLNVDGNVFAQPLLVSGYVMPDGSKHDLLIVVTGHNSVYVFDAKHYAKLWQINLGPSQLTGDVGCGDVVPEYGITSTPVVVRDPAGSATLFVVSATEPSTNNFHTHLHALDLGTGAEKQAPVEISPKATLKDGSTLTFDPKNQWNRAGLVYANGTLYMGIGSHCDNNAGKISGWLLRYGTDLALQAAFNTIQVPAGYELASIWMSGFAPAVDPSGNLFVITGNGNFAKGGKDFGESVLKLAPDLSGVSDYFTPSAYRGLNNSDLDFGSGGVMLLPPQGSGVPLAVAMGKDAVLYLLNGDRLGRIKAGDAGALQVTRLAGSGGGVWGGPAYFGGAGGPLVYYQTDSDVLRSYAVTAGSNPALTPAAQGKTVAGYGGSMPIVSSNGNNPGTGVVWLIRRGRSIQLEAYDAASLGAPIYAAQAGNWSNNAGNSFLTPLEANGRVYVPAYKTVNVFGLTP